MLKSRDLRASNELVQERETLDQIEDVFVVVLYELLPIAIQRTLKSEFLVLLSQVPPKPWNPRQPFSA